MDELMIGVIDFWSKSSLQIEKNKHHSQPNAYLVSIMQFIYFLLWSWNGLVVSLGHRDAQFGNLWYEPFDSECEIRL